MAWTHSADLPDDFFPAVIAMCDRLGCRAVDLLSVCFSESGCMAAPPHESVAWGLNQIVDLHLWGFTGDGRGYEALGPLGQLPFVEAYFKGHAPIGSVARIYIANFLPSEIGHWNEPAYVLCGRNGPYEWAYSGNWRAFDIDGKGYIAVQDLLARISRVTHGNARWNEIVARLAAAKDAVVAVAATVPAPPADTTPLPPVLPVQRGLHVLGYYTGNLDSTVGPLTTAAIRAFQHAMMIPTSGVIDWPLCQALSARLRDLATKKRAEADEDETDAGDLEPKAA